VSDWVSPYRPKNGPLSREEVRAYGRKVGTFTGLLGYFGGAIGAWAANMAFNPNINTASNGGDDVAGAIVGVAVTMLLAMWIFRYRGRPWQSERAKNAGEVVRGIGPGVAVGFGAGVTMLLVVVYAGTVVLMWVLACAFLIFAVAAS
jgi:hypothetical protein